MPHTHDPQTLKTAALLTCYGFDLRGLTPINTLEQWLESYPILWIRLAVVEALYQGRYKAISVEQLLKFWLKRGHPLFHFSDEFERLISHNLPKILLQPLSSKDEDSLERVPAPVPTVPTLLKTKLRPFSSPPEQTVVALPPKPIAELTPLESLFSLPRLFPQTAPVEKTESPPTEDSDLELAVLDELEWSESPVESWSSEKQPPIDQRTIHQFNPQRERSPWFEKLKMVLQQELTQTAASEA